MWMSFKRWWYRKHQQRIARKAIVSCGFKLEYAHFTCTICKGDILNIKEITHQHTTYSGEKFSNYDIVACTCLRCRWIMNGAATKCDDKQHPSLETFLLKYQVDEKIMNDFLRSSKNK